MMRFALQSAVFMTAVLFAGAGGLFGTAALVTGDSAAWIVSLPCLLGAVLTSIIWFTLIP